MSYTPTIQPDGYMIIKRDCKFTFEVHRDELMGSGGRYLTSNVEIEIDGKMEVVGDRFTKFGTEQ